MHFYTRPNVCFTVPTLGIRFGLGIGLVLTIVVSDLGRGDSKASVYRCEFLLISGEDWGWHNKLSIYLINLHFTCNSNAIAKHSIIAAICRLCQHLHISCTRAQCTLFCMHWLWRVTNFFSLYNLFCHMLAFSAGHRIKELYQKWLSWSYRVILKQNHCQQVWMESLLETFILLNRYFLCSIHCTLFLKFWINVTWLFLHIQ